MSVFKALIPIVGGCLVIALVVRLGPMDDTARHTRLWNELRMLGDVEADLNPEYAERLFRSALAESQAISQGGIMTALSLSDLARLHFKTRHFDDAIAEYKEATDLELKLQQSRSPECDPQFLKSDLVRLAVKTAIAQEAAKSMHEAAATYVQAVEFAARRLAERPVDQVVCDRIVDAVDGACRLAPGSKTVEVLLRLLTSEVIAPMAKVYREDIRKSLTACALSSDSGVGESLVHQIDERMNGAKHK